MERPELDEWFARGRDGDTLAVAHPDCLGRSLAELSAIVAKQEQRGIALVSLEERIDTASTTGEFAFRVFDEIAYFER